MTIESNFHEKLKTRKMLCWVWNNEPSGIDEYLVIDIIKTFNEGMYVSITKKEWEYAVPLSKSEIRDLKKYLKQLD